MEWYGELLQKDFCCFIEKSLGCVDPGATFLPNWHIELMAEYLEAMRSGQCRRLIINLPPRSLKSVCVSVAWPAWLLGQDPRSRIIAASYSAELSIKHSLDCRLVMSSSWYKALFPRTQLSREQNEKHRFLTTERGFRFATSVGGSLTGEGGNYLIIDDPLNPAQAMNRQLRDQVNGWFEHTFSTRLNDKRNGVIVLVMQRLHQGDLSGWLLDKGYWEHLCLPAIGQEKRLYRMGAVHKLREEGELLHACREGMHLVERARLDLGSSAFAAQYQQQPLPEEGSMVKQEWFRRYTQAPQGRIIQSWDTAIKSASHNDASVCLTFCEEAGNAYLLEAKSVRQEYPDLKKTVLEQAQRWMPSAILIEDKASGQQLLQDLRRESGLPVIAVHPQADKVTRFAAVSSLIEAGRLFLPQRSTWLSAFESEILAFPNANHDDQVDALTQCLDWLRKSGWKRFSVRTL